MASETRPPTTPGRRVGPYRVGYGYNHASSGDWYAFLGLDSDGDFVFANTFHHDCLRLPRRKAVRVFDPDGDCDYDAADYDAVLAEWGRPEDMT